MRATLEISGEELCLLYIATGNESAGKLIRECIKQDREFTASMKVIANNLVEKRMPKK